MKQKKRTIKCKISEKRFTVVRVDRDPKDTHSGRSFQDAMDSAMPDRGSRIEVFAVCARDAGAARLKRGQLLRSFKYKGR